MSSSAEAIITPREVESSAREANAAASLEDPQPRREDQPDEQQEQEEVQHDSYWEPAHSIEKDEGAHIAMAEAAAEEIDVAGEPEMPLVTSSDGLLTDELVTLDEDYVPQVGDLTSAFFSEMSAAAEAVSRDRKRRRGQASDADSDEEYGLQQRRAFHIPQHVIARYDPNAVPQSAEEYLFQVRVEADACPSVKRAEHIDPRAFEHRQTAYMPKLLLAARPRDAGCMPTEQWRSHFSAQFAAARQNLRCFAANNLHLKRNNSNAVKRREAVLPGKGDAHGWMVYCLGRQESRRGKARVAAAESEEATAAAASTIAASQPVLPHAPSLSLVVSLEQTEVRSILTQLLEHGSEECERRVKTAERQRQYRLRKQQQADEESKEGQDVDGESDTDEMMTSTSAAAPALSTLETSSPSSFSFPTHSYSLWLYTLFLALEKPLTDALVGEMRRCYRAISSMRAEINEPRSEVVKYANIILALCEHFGQAVQMEPLPITSEALAAVQ